nr:MAG TPA: portal protein [Caudoviricetes sp.]
MFSRLKERMKTLVNKAGQATGLVKEFKDIFEVGGVPAFNQFYYFGIFVWKYLYKGFYAPWHRILAPTIDNSYNRRDLERMDIPKAICAELASLVWNEQCEVHVSQTNIADAGATSVLEEFINDVLTKNGFWIKMQEHIEQVCALGGGAIKAWYEGKRDSSGRVIPESGGIRLGFCMADQFVPVAWNNIKVTDGVFISREARDGYYYTRLEWHKWDGLTYYITNEVYRSEYKPDNRGMTESQDILGFRYPLDEIYPFINESTALQGITTSLFAYYRTAVANNIDDNSPLGVSIYANALSTLKALDICYDSFIREFRLGKKRIIVPTQCIRKVYDPVTGEERRFFDATDEAYEALSTDDSDSLRIQDNTIELRVDEHERAINAFLSTLCLQVGFSAGTFTFDRAQGLKTATEIISENSKTYKTIKAQQVQIKEAVIQIVDAIIQIACLYDMKWQGKSIRSIAEKGWETKVVFDDSILQDRKTNIDEGILLLGNGVMSKKRFMIEKLGYTEEEAVKELLEIKNEGQILADYFDMADTSAQEVQNIDTGKSDSSKSNEQEKQSSKQEQVNVATDA